MGKHLLIRIGVTDVGGTYDPSALPDPLDQITKIYKVVLRRPTWQIMWITSMYSYSTSPSFFSFGASHWPRPRYSLYTHLSFRRKSSDAPKTLFWYFVWPGVSRWRLELYYSVFPWEKLGIHYVLQRINVRSLVSSYWLRSSPISCWTFPFLYFLSLWFEIFSCRSDRDGLSAWFFSLVACKFGYSYQPSSPSVIMSWADCHSVIITGIIKAYYSFDPKKPNKGGFLQAGVHALLTQLLVASIPMTIKLATIELGTAIICACLPTYRPLLQGSWVCNWLASARRSVGRTGSSAVAQRSSLNSHGDVRGGYDWFTDGNNSDRILLNEVAGGRRTEGSGIPFPPANAISVERRIEVSW